MIPAEVGVLAWHMPIAVSGLCPETVFI